MEKIVTNNEYFFNDVRGRKPPTLKAEKLVKAKKLYPKIAKWHSETFLIRYAKALEKYPDLKDLPAKLATIAYSFREEQLASYRTNYTTELANARCDIQLGGFKLPHKIPDDLPALNFDKECIICQEFKKGITLCPSCWQLIRKCLELKHYESRKNWTTWGVEQHLDLSNLVKLLNSDKEVKEMLKRKIQEEKGEKNE